MKAKTEVNLDSVDLNRFYDDQLEHVSGKPICLEMEVAIDLRVHVKVVELPLPISISLRTIGTVVNTVPEPATKVPSTIVRITPLAKLEYWWMKTATASTMLLNISKNDEVAIQPMIWRSSMRIVNLDQALHRQRTRTKNLQVVRVRHLRERSPCRKSPAWVDRTLPIGSLKKEKRHLRRNVRAIHLEEGSGGRNLDLVCRFKSHLIRPRHPWRNPPRPPRHPKLDP